MGITFTLNLSFAQLRAAVILKADNADNLNLPSSWVGGVVPGAGDVARWAAGVSSSNTVLLGANTSWQGISILAPSGLVTIGSGNTLTLGRAGIDMSAATQDLTITSGLTLLGNAAQTWNVAAGRTLTLNTGLFTRGSGSILNIQGAGTLAASTISNDATGIIGPWASLGTGGATQYAMVSGGNITGYTGTAAITAADITDTTGTINYDLAAAGASGAGASFNTVRYTGGAGTITGAITANGILNVGGGLLTFGNGVNIGASKELVVSTASGDVAFSDLVSDNASGSSSLIKSGAGTLSVNAVSTYTGLTVINEGIFKAGASASSSGSTSSALGTNASGTVVSDGATLDINAKMLGLEAITIFGSGVGGNGAIVSGTATQQSNALSFLTLGSDATIGGAGRWDIRNNSPSLNMNGFTLTKTGANYVGLVGVAFSNTGNIDVVQGELNFAGVTGGTAASTITVRNGATLSVFAQGTAVAWTLNLLNGAILQSENGVTTQNNFSGPVNLTGVVTFDTIDRQLTVTGSIGEQAAGASISKIGSGVLNLSGANNTFTGGITISAGIVSLRNTATKPGAGTISVGASGGLGLGTGGAGFYSAADVDSLWNNTFSGVSMNATSVVGIDTTAGNFTYSTSQSTRGLTKLGINILTITGVNTYAGNTTINQGTLKAGVAGALPFGAGKGNVVFDSFETATLDLNGFDVSINGLVQANNNSNSRVVNNATGTAKTLTLGNGNATAVYAGVIVNNTAGTGTVAVVKTGSGTQTLRGINTYTGGTTILYGTLTLDFANNATNLLSSTGAVILGGPITSQRQLGLATVMPTLSMTGKASTTNSQTISGLTLNAASNQVSVTANATANPIVLNLGAITRNVAGLVNFVTPTGAASATNGITTSTAVDATSGIIGGWAAVGGNDYAAKSGSNIVAYTGYTALATGGTISGNAAGNARVTTAAISASTANAATTDIATLSFGTGASGANTITVGAAGTGSTGILRLGAQGGILIGSGTASNTTLSIGNVVGNGKLTAGGADNVAGEIAILDFGAGSSNGVTVKSTIVDNGTGAVRLVIGQYNGGNVGVALSGANTYSGGTWLNSGRVRIDNSGAFGTGVVNVSAGAQVYVNLTNATISNDFNIAGGGSVLGVDTAVAIRLGTNTTLSGTITLKADSAIGGGSGTISGQIQGVYQLTIGRAATGGAATGLITLTGDNTYTGATNIAESTLQLGNGGTTGSINSTSGINIASGASLKTSRSDSLAVTQSITGSGTVEVANTSTGTTVFTSNSNTYSGTTTVTSGALQVGTAGVGATGTGAVTVQNGGTILGTGVVKGASFTASSGAMVQAGDGTAQSNYGTLTFTPVSGSGNFSFQSGSSVILGINPGGTGDKLVFDGLSAGTLSFNGNLTVTASGYTPVQATTFDLIDWSNVNTTSFDSRFSASSYAGYLLGNGDDNLGFDLPDISGSGFAWDIRNFMINGSISTISIVPEPGRMLFLALGIGGLLARRRRVA